MEIEQRLGIYKIAWGNAVKVSRNGQLKSESHNTYITYYKYGRFKSLGVPHDS